MLSSDPATVPVIDSVDMPSLRIRLEWMKLRITSGAPATITV